MQSSTSVERLSGRRVCSRCTATYHLGTQPPRLCGECDFDGSALTIREDDIGHNIRCNCISPARVHPTFVDGYLKKNYPGREQEMFEKLAKSQPIGRMGEPDEVASLALFLCSDAASFITGVDYPLDGGFMNLHG